MLVVAILINVISMIWIRVSRPVARISPVVCHQFLCWGTNFFLAAPSPSHPMEAVVRSPLPYLFNILLLIFINLPFLLCVTEHFWTLKSSSPALTHSVQVFPQYARLHASSAVTTFLHSFVLSSDFNMFNTTQSYMKLMNITERSGPVKPHLLMYLLLHSEMPLLPLLSGIYHSTPSIAVHSLRIRSLQIFLPVLYVDLIKCFWKIEVGPTPSTALYLHPASHIPLQKILTNL